MASLLQKGTAFYYKDFLSPDDSIFYFNSFQSELDWQTRTYNDLKLRRDTCVYADEGLTMQAPKIWGEGAVVHVWCDALSALKEQVEAFTGEQYNICLCNRYQGGKNYIGYHSDNEEYGTTKSIASVSLGTTRSFSFRNKTDLTEQVHLLLDHGSLLVMGEGCQENYTHGMKKEKVIKENPYNGTRINVTFRKFIK
jgi:hypothetical protein